MTRVHPKKLTLHPEAAAVPEMPPHQYETFLENIREVGVREPLEVLPGTLTVIDGRTRLRGALDAKLTEVPIRDAVLLPGESEVGYMLQRARLRRHLSPSQLAMIYARLTTLSQGQRKGSNPNASREAFEPSSNASREAFGQGDAAEAAGVSRASIQRASAVLEKGRESEIRAVDQGEATVTETAQAIRDREKAKDIRKAAKDDAKRFGDLAEKLDDGGDIGLIHKELRKREREGTQKKHVLLDATDHPVPAHLRDLFGDQWLRQTIEQTETLSRDAIKAILRQVNGKGGRYTPHLLLGKVTKALETAADELAIAHANLDAGRPHAVHRACEGKGCTACGKAGWLPRWRWAELKAEGKL